MVTLDQFDKGIPPEPRVTALHIEIIETPGQLATMNITTNRPISEAEASMIGLRIIERFLGRAIAAQPQPQAQAKSGLVIPKSFIQ